MLELHRPDGLTGDRLKSHNSNFRGGRRRQRPPDLHRVDVGGSFSGAGESIEPPDRVLAAAAREMAVVAIDHREAGAHVKEVERGRSRAKLYVVAPSEGRPSPETDGATAG